MKYLPGQWLRVRLSEELKHQFTLSSSPSEDFLQFTTKFGVESEYKKALWKMKVGQGVEINGPFGSFVLDTNDTAPRLFLAGGIGITPFRSMIRYNLDCNFSLDIVLVYAVKNKSQAVFVGELPAAVVESETQGRLDEIKIKNLVPDYLTRTWWVCGPPAMVESFVELAQKMGVGADKIRSEEFTGYL